MVDPQNDFLTERGVTWGVVGESVREHNVVANLERLFRAAKAADIPVVISPHYYFPTDHGWKFEGALARDATAGAKVPEGDGYLASLINFRMVANAVWRTEEAVAGIVADRR